MGISSVQSLLGAANKKASSAAVAQSTLKSVSRLRIIPRMLLPVSELMLLIQLSLLGYVIIVNVPAALQYRVETHVTGWGGEVEGWIHVAIQLALLLVAIVVIQPILLKNLVLINGLLGSHDELMHMLYRIHANLSVKDEVVKSFVQSVEERCDGELHIMRDAGAFLVCHHMPTYQCSLT